VVNPRYDVIGEDVARPTGDLGVPETVHGETWFPRFAFAPAERVLISGGGQPQRAGPQLPVLEHLSVA